MIYRPRDAARGARGAPAPEPERELVTLTLNGRAHPITRAASCSAAPGNATSAVSDGNVSRRHAEIVQEGATYSVVDLGSTNGTELNGRRITREKLADGDRITIGATDIVFGRTLP